MTSDKIFSILIKALLHMPAQCWARARLPERPKNRKLACAERKQFPFKRFVLLPACSQKRGPDGVWIIFRAKVFIYMVCFTSPPTAYGAIIAFQTDLHQLSFGPLHVTLFTNYKPVFCCTETVIQVIFSFGHYKGSVEYLLNPLNPNAVVCDVEVIQDVGRLVVPEDLMDG